MKLRLLAALAVTSGVGIAAAVPAAHALAPARVVPGALIRAGCVPRFADLPPDPCYLQISFDGHVLLTIGNVPPADNSAA
jgi:hypothetical protein